MSFMYLVLLWVLVKQLKKEEKLIEMNESSISLLESQIRNTIRNCSSPPLPLSPIGEHALASFLSLPGIEAWKHDEASAWCELSWILEHGLMFFLLENNISAKPRKKKITDAIREGNETDRSVWSEIKIGALLSYLGGKVTFLKEGFSKTPELYLEINEESVYVEVVRADGIRPNEKAVKNALYEFASLFRPGDLEYKLIFFFDDVFNKSYLSAALDAALMLSAGKVKEDHGKWAVRAIPSEDQEYAIRNIHKFDPVWWSKTKSGIVCVDFTDAIYLGIQCLMPKASYMNPISRKANSGQRRDGHPYLIAYDVEEMTNSYQDIINELHAHFSIWEHVSGVMLFQRRNYLTKQESIVSVIVNPYALLPLPKELVTLACEKQHIINFSWLANS
ncbi:MAG: hypothetical protein ACOH2E_03325 [Candidatus Paracaedibacter sp.]